MTDNIKPLFAVEKADLVDQRVVEALEILLEEARDGKIHKLAYVGIGGSGDNYYYGVAGVETMATDMLVHSGLISLAGALGEMNPARSFFYED